MQKAADKIERTLQSIVRNFMQERRKGRSEIAISMSSSLDKDLGIDSLGRVELYHRIEKAFKIQLPERVLIDANTLQDIAVAIKEAKPKQSTVEISYTAALTSAEYDQGCAETILDTLCQRAAIEPDRPHIYLQHEQGNEQIITYGELYAKSLQVACGLQALNIRAGDTVAIMLPTSTDFFYAFIGVWMLGAVPAPIYPPFRVDKLEEYAIRESGILKKAEVRVLITFHKAEVLSKLLSSFIPSLHKVTTVEALSVNKGDLEVYDAGGDTGALIQFTSGSTSAPKGVYLRHRSLIANIRAIGEAVDIKPTDVGVSWLPLYHDMGLIGSWLNALYFAFPITIMSPFAFLTRPERWLWAIHYHRATYSGAPNFAYELCVNKIDDDAIAGLDLSSWRLAFNGAEAVNPRTLERFCKKFSPYGFKPETFFPVYGLAESSVALLFPPPGRAPRIDQRGRVGLVSCGTPIPKHEARVVNDSMELQPEGEPGRLQFRGPSAMYGYYNDLEKTKEVFFDGWWDTGDIAYQLDGEYYISGRSKDMIIKAGNNLYPEEMEDIASQVNGVRKGCVVAFGIEEEISGTERLIIVAEIREGDRIYKDKIINEITEKILLIVGVTPDEVILVDPHTVPKTSSGKLQRSACKELYLKHKLGGFRVPVWLQLSNIFIKGAIATVSSWFAILAKSIYALYVLTIGILTIPPMWLAFVILTDQQRWRLAKGWTKLWIKMSGISVEIIGKDNISENETYVFVANHASYIDSIILMSVMPPDAAFVAKRELLKAPIISTIIQRLKYLTVDRYDVSKSIEDAKMINKTLENKRSIVIFPEGTFSYAPGLRPFKLGAFQAASATGTAVCPVALQGTRKIMRGDKWLMWPGKVKVFIGQPIVAEQTDWHGINQLQEQAQDFISANCGEALIDVV